MFEKFIMGLIVLNVLSFMLGTVASINANATMQARLAPSPFRVPLCAARTLKRHSPRTGHSIARVRGR